MKNSYLFPYITLMLYMASQSSAFAQATKVNVQVTKDYNSTVIDTAWISYQTDFSEMPKKVQILYTHFSPATFSFNLKNTVGTLKVIVKGESSRALSTIYVEGGDNVHVNITGKEKETKAFFINPKYKVDGQLDSVTFWGQYPVNHNKVERGMPINLKTIYYRFKLVQEEKLKILNNVKDKMSHELYNLYRADIEGRYLFNASATGLNFLDESNFNKGLYPVITDFLQTEIDTIAKGSRLNSNELLKGIQNYIKLKYAIENGKSPNMIELYQEFKKQLSASWKEKVIYQFLMSVPKGEPKDLKACIEDALTIITNGSQQKALGNLLELKTGGKRAFNFSLVDKNEKTFRLADFRGKIVLLDFWFTGCPGCLGLAAVMEKEILPLFKNNKDFLYVTINIDKDKSLWFASIAEGKYTTSENMNLFTSGLGDNHPVIKNYGVKEYPTLILIDKDGKIINANIDRKDIAKIISSAL